MSGTTGTTAGTSWTWPEALFGGALLLVMWWLLLDVKLWQPDTLFLGVDNVQIAEAQAWWQGRCDLPMRPWDTAVFEGRYYSFLPPAFTFLAAAVVPFFGGVPHGYLLGVVVLPVPLLAFAAYLKWTGSVLWAQLLALTLVCGTSCRQVTLMAFSFGMPYFVNHLLAVTGVLLLLVAWPRRLGWASAGWLLSVLARQMTIALALPIVWALKRGQTTAGPGERAYRRWVVPGACAALLLATVSGLNWLKFGNPLDTGYEYIYVGRTDPVATDALTIGLFSPRFVLRNLYYTNLGFPEWVSFPGGRALIPNEFGTGIWWTTPLLLWVLIDARRIWQEPGERMLLTGAILIYAALLFYHNTGWSQPGYNRFSLDYLPVVLALVGRRCFAGWRRWLSFGMIGWSVAYFSWWV